MADWHNARDSFDDNQAVVVVVAGIDFVAASFAAADAVLADESWLPGLDPGCIVAAAAAADSWEQTCAVVPHTPLDAVDIVDSGGAWVRWLHVAGPLHRLHWPVWAARVAAAEACSAEASAGTQFDDLWASWVQQVEWLPPGGLRRPVGTATAARTATSVAWEALAVLECAGALRTGQPVAFACLCATVLVASWDLAAAVVVVVVVDLDAGLCCIACADSMFAVAVPTSDSCARDHSHEWARSSASCQAHASVPWALLSPWAPCARPD